jgi:hypothetical protein
MSSFLRERAKSVADNLVASLLIAAGSAVIGWIVQHWAAIKGLDWGFSIPLGVAAFVFFCSSLLLLKPKPRAVKWVRLGPENSSPPIVIHNSPRFENSPSFTNAPQVDQAALLQMQLQPQSETRNRPDPVFESRGTRFRRYGFNTQTGELIREQYDGGDVYDHIRFVDAALVRFLYRADPGVDPRLRVHAHMSIYTNAQSQRGEWTFTTLKSLEHSSASCDIYKPIWDDDEPHVSVEFSAGYAHELIVGLVPAEDKPRGIIGYEYGSRAVSSYMGTERVFAPEIHNLEARSFVIRVELIPKLWNEVRCKLPSFWFHLALIEKPELKFLRMID